MKIEKITKIYIELDLERCESQLITMFFKLIFFLLTKQKRKKKRKMPEQLSLANTGFIPWNFIH